MVVKLKISQFRKAVGAVVVYDLTRENTFEKVGNWLEELPDLTKTDPVVVLIGNKLDLVKNNPSKRGVPQEKVRQFCRQRGVQYFETCAFDGADEVNKPFLGLVGGKTSA